MTSGQNSILAIVGMTGSGKSAACEVLRARGWTSIRFGQVTIDKLIEVGQALTPENEKTMREHLRAEMGMGAYATILLPQIEDALDDGPVVLDGLYSWSEYKILKERFAGRLTLVHVFAPPEVRYRRLGERKETENDSAKTVRTLTEKGGPIAMADFVIDNQSNLDHLRRRVLEIAGLS